MSIIIIGAGSAMSQSIARLFGERGFSIGLIGRTEEKLKKITESLTSQGIQNRYALTNVINEMGLRKALNDLEYHVGRANMILYNAVARSSERIPDLEWTSVRDQLDVTVGGAFHLMHIKLPEYLRRNRGKLFFTGGGVALNGNPQNVPMGMGKAALRNMIQAVTHEVKGTRVHIAQLTICQKVTETDEKYNYKAIAEQFWKLFTQKPDHFEDEIIY